MSNTPPAEPGYTAPDLALVGEDHLRAYEESNGAEGYYWNGVPTLILTTIGRKSGVARKIPIIYREVDGDYILIASKGGAPTHPDWYFNIGANPKVEVQVRDEKFSATAETVEGPERDRLWDLAAEKWPNYNVYTTRTDRRIPVVRLRKDGAAHA